LKGRRLYNFSPFKGEVERRMGFLYSAQVDNFECSDFSGRMLNKAVL